MARKKADFRFVLKGAGTLEDLPLGDVAELLRGLVALVARGAAEELNRPITGTGRWEGPVEQAAELRLVGLRNGSVVADVGYPPPRQTDVLFASVGNLTDRALDRLFDAASGHADRHPTIAAAYADVLDRFSTTPDATLTLVDLRESVQKPERATIKVSERAHLRAVARAASIRAMDKDVTGRIFEADLEAYTAKVRTPAGEKVEVTFTPALAADFESRFGKRAELRGEVVFDPATQRVKAFRALQILEGTQLAFGGVHFWGTKSLEALVEEQGSVPISDPEDLVVDDITDEQWEAFFGALGVGR